jgi:hypothetical protein
MNYIKFPTLTITVLVVLLSIYICKLFSCNLQTEQYLLDFDEMQAEAMEYVKNNYDDDYSQYGYYTLFIDDNDNLSLIAITFLVDTTHAYDVYFDDNGVLKKGNKISLSYNTKSLEEYKNTNGIYVLKGTYGSYLLAEDDSLTYTGGISFDNLSSTDKIDSSVFNNKFILREYGINVSELYNYKITKMNDEG